MQALEYSVTLWRWQEHLSPAKSPQGWPYHINIHFRANLIFKLSSWPRGYLEALHAMCSFFLQEHEPLRHHHSTSPAFRSPQESPEPPWPQKVLRGNSSTTSPFLEELDLILYLASGVASPSQVEDGESPSQVALFCDPLGSQGQP